MKHILSVFLLLLLSDSNVTYVQQVSTTHLHIIFTKQANNNLKRVLNADLLCDREVYSTSAARVL